MEKLENLEKQWWQPPPYGRRSPMEKHGRHSAADAASAGGLEGIVNPG